VAKSSQIKEVYMKVDIPFAERWRDVMLNDQKLCTARDKYYGRKGDTFEAFGAAFEIQFVSLIPLDEVALFFYALEGCSSPEESQEVWAAIHPGEPWEPQRLMKVHWFRRLPPSESLSTRIARDGDLLILSHTPINDECSGPQPCRS
jgi:hypothetical protein